VAVASVAVASVVVASVTGLAFFTRNPVATHLAGALDLLFAGMALGAVVATERSARRDRPRTGGSVGGWSSRA
jgi:hypothetical protein